MLKFAMPPIAAKALNISGEAGPEIEAHGKLPEDEPAIESYCQQVCGGGECGTGTVCQHGIDPTTELPVVSFDGKLPERKVSLASMSLKFQLPDDFGAGWDYRRVICYPQGHAYAGSYDRDEIGNFAHDALGRIEGLSESALYVGANCNATFEVDSLAEANGIETALQRIVDAFPVRPERHIDIRGANHWDSRVSEYFDDQENSVVEDVPFRAYLVQHVPLSSEHAAIDGASTDDVLAEYGICAKASASISPRP
ncbi:hypothetical protein KDX16_32020 [Burkholderia vietnamiensis]|uniref:Uncharacterized protein n=2 Tax=Burkholderia cepacia complex TaxID=87882 RepID=A0A228HMG1_9BURK|nr:MULTISPECIES: hypothetical protein [Burkholderia]HDR9758719.1 hypothetical protein [Burkholderia cepacia ATCC 25416]MBR7920426.1 hypothetical protein [Burkholderia vietnamiensis]MBR8054788.1 hypothetical protein [Burkholderia vietnamiensis]MDN7570139.1 hypothetical protein [Burkholderia contaminans]OXI31075.1 hypothetical protein CFB84_42510 [Burkholderia aenigmatica]